ncbi:MAG: cell division protein FtsI [Thiotrichales bacterium]|nr:MAG: cell division protein FtsI [Thiotrichales bacterium]
MLLLLAGICVLLVRAAYLDLFQQSWLKKQAGKRQLRTLVVPPYRGMIVDRNGEALAVSSPVASISIDPRRLADAKREMKKVALEDSEDGILAREDLKILDEKLANVESLLEMPEGALLDRLDAVSGKRFHYLARHVEPEKAQKVADLHIPAVHVKREYRRFYPMAETTAHVVGFTNIDDQGIEGVERSMNDRLAGHAGRNRVIRDGRGRLVESIEEIEAMAPGEMVQLSLDHRIQYAAYKLLKGEVYKLNAKSGSVVVLDTVSGEVLAMANMPSFNPNDRTSLKPYQYRNRAVVDSFEPGSTLKPITIAAALEARAVGEDVSIETSPGKFKIGKVTIKDPKNYGAITLSKILAKSSNVGASKVALLMESSEHWKFLNRVGFGRKPDAGFFSETEGKLAYYDEWGRVDRASHGYGYGMSASLLQLAHAYTVFATGGILNPLSIYKRESQPLGQQVMTKANAKAVLKMMMAVVQADATGKYAVVDGYNVAGKTGTAYKLKNGRYSKDHLIVSFIGIAPATNPRLVVAVMIDEPKVKRASGGRLAAPLFSKIMTNALRIMDIAPDNLPQLKQAKPQLPLKSLAPVTVNSPVFPVVIENEGRA